MSTADEQRLNQFGFELNSLINLGARLILIITAKYPSFISNVHIPHLTGLDLYNSER